MPHNRPKRKSSPVELGIITLAGRRFLSYNFKWTNRTDQVYKPKLIEETSTAA